MNKDSNRLKCGLRRLLARCGYYGSMPIREEMKEVSGEISLGRAILDKALYDLSTAKESVREDAEYWFSPRNEDFRTICIMADLDYKEVYKFVRDNWDILREPLKVELAKKRASRKEKKKRIIIPQP